MAHRRRIKNWFLPAISFGKEAEKSKLSGADDKDERCGLAIYTTRAVCMVLDLA